MKKWLIFFNNSADLRLRRHLCNSHLRIGLGLHFIDGLLHNIKVSELLFILNVLSLYRPNHFDRFSELFFCILYILLMLDFHFIEIRGYLNFGSLIYWIVKSITVVKILGRAIVDRRLSFMVEVLDLKTLEKGIDITYLLCLHRI